MSNRQMKVAVCSDRDVTIPTRGVDFVTYWQQYLNNVPLEYRDEATIEVYTGYDYEDAVICVDIYYFRDETLEEVADRERLEIFETNRQTASDYANLQRLGQKYNLRITPIKGDNNE